MERALRAAGGGFSQSPSGTGRATGPGRDSCPRRRTRDWERLHNLFRRPPLSDPALRGSGGNAPAAAAGGTPAGWRVESLLSGTLSGDRRVRRAANRVEHKQGTNRWFEKITTPAGKAPGCRASSIAPVRRCGNAFTAEDRPIRKTRFSYVQSLSSEIPPKQWILASSRALQALRKHSRVLRHRRAPTDCFGANPVASALDGPAGRDPDQAVRTYHEGLKQNPQIGTFYLAGNRNFLFGSDTALPHWLSGYTVKTDRVSMVSIFPPNLFPPNQGP